MLGQPNEPTAAEEAEHLVGLLDAEKAAERLDPLEQAESRVRALQVRVDELEARHGYLERSLAPLCCCSYPDEPEGPYDGVERECPLHGDGESFVHHVQEQEQRLAQARGHISDLERSDLEHENLRRMLGSLCPCTTDPNSDVYGPLQNCPLHGDGESFVAWFQELERNKVSRLLTRALVRSGKPLMPWPEASQDLALVATMFDEHRLRYVGVRQRDHDELSDALGAERGTRSWEELVRQVRLLNQYPDFPGMG